ncbi:MAG: DUF4230 domain-containing protein [Verrucomicrobiia bacterium]
MWKHIKLYTMSAIIIALGATALYYRHQATRGVGAVRRTIDPPAIVQEIKALQELATVKYTIQKVIGLEEEKVPFGSESLLMVVQATVKGGIDLSELATQDVRVAADNCVTIKLPPPKILDIYINDKETKVWQRTKTWWTPWVSFNPEMEQQARLAAREYVQAAALKMNILSNAQQNAETTIRRFLHLLGTESVRFETATATPTSLPPVEAH